MSRSGYDDIPIPAFVVPFGYPNQYSIYIYDADNTKWELLENVSFSATKKINQISDFKIHFIDIDETAKLYVKEFATIMIFVENTLFLKGRVQRVTYSTSYECDVEGYGMEAKLLEKNFVKAGDDRVQYENISAQTIANEILSSDSTGSTPWIVNPSTTGIFDTDYGDLSIRFEYTSRMKALVGLADALDYEWWISQSVNPYTTDYFNMASRMGRTTPLFTYNISGDDPNCEITTYERDVNNMANSVSVLGYGDGINQVKTIFYAASDVYSLITTEVADDSSTIVVADANSFPATGIIKIGNELVPYTSHDGTTFTCTRDNNAKIHKIGVAAFEWYDGDGLDTTILNGAIVSNDLTITVDDTSTFAASGYIIIGGEIIKYDSKNATTFTITPASPGPVGRGYYNTTASKHADNTRVFQFDSSKLYTTGPAEITGTAAKTGSSISDNGLLDYPYIDRTLRDEATAELIASGKLIEAKEPVVRIKVIPADIINDAQEIGLGDVVTVNDIESGINGQEQRVVSIMVSLGEDGMEVAELELSNKSLEFIEQMTSLRDKSEKEGKYMKGQTVLLPIGPVQENTDSTAGNEMNMRFYLPADVVAINSAIVNFSVADFRGDSVMNPSGAGSTSGYNSAPASSNSTYTEYSIDSYGEDWTTVGAGQVISIDTEYVVVYAHIFINTIPTTSNAIVHAQVYDGTNKYPNDGADDGIALGFDSYGFTADEGGSHYHEPTGSTTNFAVVDLGEWIATGDGDYIYASAPNVVGTAASTTIDNDPTPYTTVNMQNVCCIIVPGNMNGKTISLRLKNDISGDHFHATVYINYYAVGQHTHSVSAHTHTSTYSIVDGGGSDATITLNVGNDGSETKIGATDAYSGTNNSIEIQEYIPSGAGVKNIQFKPNKACRIEAIGYIKCFIESKIV